MKTNTLTLKIINDQDILSSMPKAVSLLKEHEDLIKMIVKTTVDECFKHFKYQQPTVQIGC